jgi:hypothetical protein
VSELTLRWMRVETGLWAAGPYVLRRRKNGSWRITRSERPWRRAGTLREAKALCCEDYVDLQARLP